IDDDNDKARNGVTLDELHGAVHRAVKLAFLTQPSPESQGLGLVDVTAAQIAVDAHLLAGQSVEIETGSDLGDAFRSLRDHDELGNGNDQENDEPNRDIA